ncbi:MAG TPA: GWxTD domain-containing protein [Acidobacteriota bacterium]|nr:GWxTD domain-containing protein [Acidobacteriota bacterium]
MSLPLLALAIFLTEPFAIEPKVWLGEVEYIISAGEKEEFLELETDPEREEFIREFWLRRDLDPSTEANEFREAYYQRIDRANKEFGRRSDRARVFVTNGKPDQKLVFPGMNFEEVLTQSGRASRQSTGTPGGGRTAEGSIPSIRINSPEAELWTYYHASGSRNLVGPLELIFMRIPAGELSTLYAAPHIRNQTLLALMLGNTPLFRGDRTAAADFTLVYAGPPRFSEIQDFYHQLLTRPATFDAMDIARTIAEARRSLGDVNQRASRRQELREEVASAVFFDTIDASLDYWVFRSAEKYVYLPFALMIPGDQLDPSRRFDIVAEMKRDGSSVAYFIDHLNLREADHGRLKHEGVVYQSRFAVSPGDYLLDLHVLDRDQGRYLHLSEAISVRDFGNSGFSLSDVVLCNKVVGEKEAKRTSGMESTRDWLTYSDLNPLNADDLLLVPKPDLRFRRKEQLTVFFEVYEPSVVKDEPNVEVRLKLFRDGTELVIEGVENLQYLTEGQLLKISFAQSLSLAQLSPGRYELEIEVRDMHTGETAKDKQSFEVL